MKPNYQGGGRSAFVSQSHAALKDAEVVTVYRNSLRQWRLSVKLDGGQVLHDVIPPVEYSGVRSGKRGILPRVGERGMVGFTRDQNTRKARWIQGEDSHVYGLENERDEEVHIHPSGFAESLTADGTKTVRMPGGGLFVWGPGMPYQFMLRNEKGELYEAPTLSAPTFLRLVDENLLLVDLEMLGSMRLKMDARKGRIEFFSGENGVVLEEGGADFVFPISRFGEDPDNASPLAKAPETEAVLKALSDELLSHRREIENLRGEIKALKLLMETHVHLSPGAPATPNFLPSLPIPMPTQHDLTGTGVKIPPLGTESLRSE